MGPTPFKITNVWLCYVHKIATSWQISAVTWSLFKALSLPAGLTWLFLELAISWIFFCSDSSL